MANTNIIHIITHSEFIRLLYNFIQFCIYFIYIRYSDKIAKLSDHIYQIGIDATKLCKEEFNVITHGDFHVNNMLFRYNNDGKPIDHIFVSIIIYITLKIYFFNLDK